MLNALQSRRYASLVLGLALMTACVDKAPPATWPEPPPPVLAEPIGGETVASESQGARAEPSRALEGTNDPSEGSVALEPASAAVDTPPTSRGAAAAEPKTETQATPK